MAGSSSVGTDPSAAYTIRRARRGSRCANRWRKVDALDGRSAVTKNPSAPPSGTASIVAAMSSGAASSHSPVGHLPSERAEFRHEARLSTPSPQVWSSQGRGSSPAEDLAGVAPESGARLHGVGGEPEQVRRLFRGVQVLHGVRDERRLGMSPCVLNKRLGIRGGIGSDQDIDPFQLDQTTGFLEGTEAFAGAPQHEIDGSSPTETPSIPSTGPLPWSRPPRWIRESSAPASATS